MNNYASSWNEHSVFTCLSISNTFLTISLMTIITLLEETMRIIIVSAVQLLSHFQMLTRQNPVKSCHFLFCPFRSDIYDHRCAKARNAETWRQEQTHTWKFVYSLSLLFQRSQSYWRESKRETNLSQRRKRKLYANRAWLSCLSYVYCSSRWGKRVSHMYICMHAN